MRVARTLLAAALSIGGLTYVAAANPGAVAPRHSLAVQQSTAAPPSSSQVTPPREKDSVRFAIIGDSGTGTSSQYDVGGQLTKARQLFPFEFVIMLGDNIYGSERPQDFVNKFEKPYQGLLDAKMPFYAALGQSRRPDAALLQAVQHERRALSTPSPKGTPASSCSTATTWTRHSSRGSSRNCRAPTITGRSPISTTRCTRPARSMDRKSTCARSVEPLFIKYGVDVVFAGHEHFYERIKPQNGHLLLHRRRVGQAAQG